MTTIYYLTAILFIWVELQWIVSPIEKANESRIFFVLSKLNKGKKWDECSDEYKSKLKSKIWLLWIYVWMFLGLLTFQWVVFLAMIVFQIFIISPISKLTIFTFAYTIIHWVNSIIGFGFSVFVLINHYHLKLDLTQYIMQIFTN